MWFFKSVLIYISNAIKFGCFVTFSLYDSGLGLIKVLSTKNDISQKWLCLTKLSITTTDYPLAQVKCHLIRSSVIQTELQYHITDCSEWREISVTTQTDSTVLLSAIAVSDCVWLCHWMAPRVTTGMSLLTHCGLVTPFGDMELGQHLLQVMACCLTAPSHYLNQCWLIITEALWHSSRGIIIRRCENTDQ